ncbi:MAG: WG repeat-containing protein [Bacteroidota bacterium]
MRNRLLSYAYFVFALALAGCGETSGIFTKNQYENARYIIELNGKVGFIDYEGQVVIEPQFDDAREFSEGMAAVKMNDRWGYIDLYGKIVVEPSFGMGTGEFKDGLAPARVVEGLHNWEGPMGFIDKDGSFEVPAGFEKVKRLSEGLAPVMDENGNWGAIDRYGILKIPFAFEDMGEFSEGLAFAKKDGQYGFIDKKGEIEIPYQFKDASNFANGVAPVLIAYGEFDRWWAIIGKNGGIIIEDGEIGNIPANAPEINGGLICILDPSTSRYGYMNSTGEWVITPQFDWAYGFSEGLASVNKDGKWGFIDKKGQTVIGYRDFEEGSRFINGLAAISINGNWNNYINKKGEFVYRTKK